MLRAALWTMPCLAHTDGPPPTSALNDEADEALHLGEEADEDEDEDVDEAEQVLHVEARRDGA